MIIVEKIQIPGMETREPRRLYVSLPKGYEEGSERYPVLYMFDGHNVFYDHHATYGKSWGMREYLQRSGRRLIVVAIECNPEGNNRLSEYAPWDFTSRHFGSIRGRGAETMEWLAGSLKPQIDARYRTLLDREHTLIAGSSMGGLMSVYAAVRYNAVYSRAAALSPSLFFGTRGLSKLLRETPLAAPTRIYLDYGSEEAGGTRPLELMFQTAQKLSKNGANVAARTVPGAYHSEAWWEKRIPVFMEYLLEEGETP